MPGAGGDAASANFRLSATLPESPAGPQGVSANFRLNMDLVPAAFLPDDTTPPVLTVTPQVLYISHDRALIEWQTNEPADGVVAYGTTPAYGQAASQGVAFTTLHQVLITGLSASTLYNYRAASTDPFLNGPSNSANGTFATLAAPDLAPPVVSAPVVIFIATTAARIEFTTNEAAQTDLKHGPTAALGTGTLDDQWRSTHARDLSGLPPGATWFYAVDATDPAGNLAAGATANFQMPDAVAFATTALPAATRGKGYSGTVQVTGGVGAVTVSLDSGVLPPGLVLGPAGAFSGSPSQSGTFNFSLRAADSGTPTSVAVLPFTLSVKSPATPAKESDGCAQGPFTPIFPAAILVGFAAVVFIRRRVAI
jgi:hypothetical protein